MKNLGLDKLGETWYTIYMEVIEHIGGIMDNKQAAAEAIKRWGRRAVCQVFGPRQVKMVGIEMLGCMMVKGQGDTWEAAFSNADTKGKL